MIMIMSLVVIMSSLRHRFPLDHKNLMFMVMIMIMFMIFMSLVGTKPHDYDYVFGCDYVVLKIPVPTRS